MLEVGGYKQKREIRTTFYMGGSGTLVDGIRRWFQRRSNHNNHDHINNINKTTSSDVSSSGCPQSSVNVKEGIKGTEEEQLTVIEDFDISDLKLIRVPKRIHFPPGSTMDLQKKGSAEADFFTEYGEASQYQVQEVIGKGSYGVVGSAIDSHTGERVAIKKINDVFEHVSDATRILREIKLLRLLRHPDIVEIKHIMLPPSRREFKDIYVVFELMESDLHQVIKANDDLTPEHYQFFLYQLLRGLKYIHTANVFHRDLKPKNILANADCKLKICDFGLARVSFNDAPSAILWTDYVATRWYRAPELCGSFFSKYTPAIDIWSIGCIFAEMLTGKPLFPGKNVVHQLDLMTDLLGTPPPESISKIRNEKARRYLSNMRKKPPVPFPQKFPNVDPLALRLLEGLLAFDPKDRPTAEEALANPYFNGLSNVECEPSTQPISKLEFEFERKKITKDDVRELIYREILEYHPQMLKEYLRGGEQTSFMYPSGVDRFKRQFAHLEEHYGKGERSTPLQRQHASLPRERVPAPKDETAAQSTDIERRTAPSVAKSLESPPGSQQADGSEDVTVAAQNGSSKPNYSNRSLLKSSSISASKCVVVKPKGDSEEIIEDASDEDVNDLSQKVATL
ncbi:mitogen-activated protein kinase 9 [Populus alba]|nr:mitogen-activated protein kinase 9-like [Populus alba]KAJ6970022.1 mitogen-activated protein kinase 9-like [Populus alba x Populus x berolinensis]